MRIFFRRVLLNSVIKFLLYWVFARIFEFFMYNFTCILGFVVLCYFVLDRHGQYNITNKICHDFFVALHLQYIIDKFHILYNCILMIWVSCQCYFIFRSLLMFGNSDIPFTFSNSRLHDYNEHYEIIFTKLHIQIFT